jgi:hypothetical protein
MGDPVYSRTKAGSGNLRFFLTDCLACGFTLLTPPLKLETLSLNPDETFLNSHFIYLNSKYNVIS